MKKTILAIALVFIGLTANAQFYVSASGGYSIGSAGMKLGEETTASNTENNYGSYGQGLNAQLKAGYFFNQKNGIEMSLGYLHGDDQTAMKISGIPGTSADIIARGRAYGLSLSYVHNFTENFYGRFGGLVKVGGRTEVIGKFGTVLPAALTGAPIDTNLNVEYEQHYKGKLPLGFIGAFGYKHNISKNISIFGELEYMGVSVTRDKATMEKFNASIAETGSELSLDEVRGILTTAGSSLANSLYQEIDYVDKIATTDSERGTTKQLAQKVPYSSFGINFGVTFSLESKNQ